MVDLSAPPPSPIAGSRRASNDAVSTDYLLHVPELVLPDRVGTSKMVPTVDFNSLLVRDPKASEAAAEALASAGCFQLLNHDVSAHMLRAALAAAAGIFRLPPESKKMVERSAQLGVGFADVGEGEEEDMFEEFVWSHHDGFRFKLQQVWPTGFSSFSEKMERVSSAIEEVHRTIMQSLHNLDDHCSIATQGLRFNGSSRIVCCIYKHPHNIPVDQCISSFRYDIIRMMIQGSDYPHTLSFHVCEAECSEFHVYSNKGWVSFAPTPNALIVTAGDRIQGQYKHVIGRPIYSPNWQENSISMAFLFSPTCNSRTSQHKQEEAEHTITVQQQALFAVLFTFACQLLLLFCQKF